MEADAAEIRAKQWFKIAPLLLAEALASCDRVDCGFRRWRQFAPCATLRGTCGLTKHPCRGVTLWATATAGAARALGRIRHAQDLLGHAVRILFVDIARCTDRQFCLQSTDPKGPIGCMPALESGDLLRGLRVFSEAVHGSNASEGGPPLQKI